MITRWWGTKGWDGGTTQEPKGTPIKIKHLGLRHLCGFMGQSVVTGQGILGHPGDKHEPSLQGVLIPSKLVHLDFSGLRELDTGGGACLFL